MTQRTLPHVFALAVAALLLVSTLTSQGINAQKKNEKKPAQPLCSATEKAEIIKKIRDAMKADPLLKDQWKHINVDIGIDRKDQQQKVFLEGWAEPLANRRAMTRHANKVLTEVQCVKKVLNLLGSGPFGCDPPEFQECPNGACILASRSCNSAGN